MVKKYFELGNIEDSRLVKIFRVIFGVVCIIIAVFWAIYNGQSVGPDYKLWITVVFLSGFGFYQIWSGLGKASRFIEINSSVILIRKNAVLPPVKILAEDINKIEFFPLNTIFSLKTNKKIMLRFGTVNYETNEKIVDELISFAEINKILYEIMEENL